MEVYELCSANGDSMFAVSLIVANAHEGMIVVHPENCGVRGSDIVCPCEKIRKACKSRLRFKWSSYWHTWSRIIDHNGPWFVELDLEPPPHVYGSDSDWPSIREGRYRVHLTALSPNDRVVGLEDLPADLIERMNANMPADRAEFLRTGSVTGEIREDLSGIYRANKLRFGALLTSEINATLAQFPPEGASRG
jgi:hypothetical protein